MKNIRITLVLWLIALNGMGQDGGFTGMGNSSVMLYDFWAFFNNQAGLSDMERPEIGANYNYNYEVWETGSQALAFVLPTRSGNFAIGGYRFGYSGYAENNLSLVYARNLGKYFSASLAFNYIFYTQSEVSTYKGAFLMQVGMIYKPIDKLQIGVHCYNLTMATLVDYDDKPVPTVVRFGAGYFFTPEILFTLETEKDLEQPYRFKTGLEYQVVNGFFIRTGFLTEPNQFSLGIGYAQQAFRFDLAAVTHESLPISYQISFNYIFN